MRKMDLSETLVAGADHSSPFPVPPGRFWAKLHPRREPVEWHPLIAHSADVAAVLGALLAPGGVLSRRLGRSLGQDQLTEVQRSSLVFLAALHDMGKAGNGFQAKAGTGGGRIRYSGHQQGHVTTFLSSLVVPSLREIVRRQVLPGLSRDPGNAQ